MTLQEWDDSPDTYTYLESEIGGVITVVSNESIHGPEHHKALFHLSDYTVSSVCGSVVYLEPRGK